MIRPTCCKEATRYIVWGFNRHAEDHGWLLTPVITGTMARAQEETPVACPFCGDWLPRLVDR